MKNTVLRLLLLLLISGNALFSGNHNECNTLTDNYFYIDTYWGTQVSGIRKEDYVLSNYSPYYQFSIGRWFTPYLALALSYQGPYFNFIGDEYKHKYIYIDGQVVFNINNIVCNKYSFWNIHLIIGSGYFYNYFYKRPNICANAGFVNEFKINDNLYIKIKMSAIMGWAIYQNDKDALPNISLGLSKRF